MALRSSWEGFLRFNLISVPVKAYSVTAGGRGKIGFNQLHAECGNRIKHKKVCPIHGEVGNEEIVSGYEYAKGQYVTVERGELEELEAESDKAITIAAFVHGDAVDPIYFTGRSYFLAPDGKVADKPYAVLERVMAEQERHAIAQVVFSGKGQLALIRPVEGLLAMSLLSYDDQVKKPTMFRDEVPEAEPAAEEMKLAATLIETATVKKLDYAKYHDQYAERVTELIESKAKGKQQVRPQKAEEPAVINLMDALKRSLHQAQSGKASKGKAPRKAKGRPRETAVKRRKTG